MGDDLGFTRRCVADHNVHIAVRQHVQGNAATGRDELDVGAGLRSERGQHHLEQPGIVAAGGRREGDAVVLRRRETRGNAQASRDDEGRRVLAYGAAP
jgi:hypothetical protein